jgi:enoyl-CoA hydratase
MINAAATLLIHPTDPAIRLIAFNRPEAANALNMAMARELKQQVHSLAGTPCRAVVLTGEGRHFCAGADLKERKGMDESQWQEQHHAFEDALHAVLHCDIPVIAAVNGSAFGGGLELAMACDFIYAADTARFALSEATLGIMPGMGGTQMLPRLIGYARARELTYLGKPFSAAEACQWGLVNQVFPADTVVEQALACAKNISLNAPLAVKAIKKAMNEGRAMPIPAALECELVYYNTLLATKDRREGINAFNGKRKPVFTGE